MQSPMTPINILFISSEDKARIMHQLLHIVGAHNEHQRSDRDAYVTMDYAHPLVDPNGKTILDFLCTLAFIYFQTPPPYILLQI